VTQLDEVVALEQELLTPQCRGNAERVSQLLHADFREYVASGRGWARTEIIDSLAESPSVAGEAVDFLSHEPVDGVLLLSYRISGLRPSLRSSVWVRADNRWQMLFHQGTLTAAGTEHG